jgi:hypothetical protein
LAPESIPAGFIATGPFELTSDLVPGVQTVVAFGFQGRGEVRGRVSVEGETELPSMMVKLNGEPWTRTDSAGFFVGEVPAGNVRISLNTEGRDQTYLFLTPKDVDLSISPNQNYETGFALTLAATVRLRIVDPDGRPVSGVAVHWSDGFVYSDLDGWVLLQPIAPGTQIIEIAEETLPPQMLAPTKAVSLELIPGQRLERELRLGRK